jgi:hypothetical protein
MIRYSAIVEVARHADGAIPSALIAAAYRASVAAPVLMVLRDVEVAAIDRILDPLVSKNAKPVHGVVYVHAADESRILRAAREALFAVTTTPSLGRLLASHGLTSLSVEELEQALASPSTAATVPMIKGRHLLDTTTPTAARA